MKVGFIIAMESEYEPFLSRLGALEKTERICGMDFCSYKSNEKSVILAKCGIGTVAAATAAAILIGHFTCDHILNYGLVGALDDTPVGSLVAVLDVVHYDSDLTAFGHPLGAACDMSSPFLPSDPVMLSSLMDKGLPAVRLACGDKFIADDKLKFKLHTDFSAGICDMEGAGIAIVCARAGIPFTMIKLVSDGAGDDAVSTYSTSKSAAFDFAIDAVLDAIRRT